MLAIVYESSDQSKAIGGSSIKRNESCGALYSRIILRNKFFKYLVDIYFGKTSSDPPSVQTNRNY